MANEEVTNGLNWEFSPPTTYEMRSYSPMGLPTMVSRFACDLAEWSSLA